MLTLPIKKKWFDMILSGEKKEEYREIKPYWTNRFIRRCVIFDHEVTEKEKKYLLFGEENMCTTVLFKNGYNTNSPKIKCKVKIFQGYGKSEWGAEPGKLYYVLKILSVEEVTDVKD